MNRPPGQDILISLAWIGPKNVELTAEVADIWQTIHFGPDRFERVWGDALAAGKAKRDPDRPPIEIIAGGTVALGDGPHIQEARNAARGLIGFYLGGMGAKSKNFYNDLFKRYGWEQEAEQIQDLFLSGQRAEAFAASPTSTSTCRRSSATRDGSASASRCSRDVGVTYLNVTPHGPDPLGTIERIKTWAQ